MSLPSGTPTADERAATFDYLGHIMPIEGLTWTVEEALDLWERLYVITGGYSRTAKLDLLCGKCGRRYTTAEASAIDDCLPHVMPVTNRRKKAAPRYGERRPPALREIKVSQPSNVHLSARFELVCHPKCGAVAVVRADRLTEAFISAAERGRLNLILGAGRKATEAGGADL